jgi:hypothetical protein
MKQLIIVTTILLTSTFLNRVSAQISISINIHDQPSWGPVGYDHVDYYYIPDIRCYYFVPGHQFVYLRGDRWTFSYNLPPAYPNFDLYHCHKVVLDDPRPYLHDDVYRAKYAEFRGHGPNGQEFIKGSKDDRYQDHWHDQNEADEDFRHHDNGKHKGWDKHEN